MGKSGTVSKSLDELADELKRVSRTVRRIESGQIPLKLASVGIFLVVCYTGALVAEGVFFGRQAWNQLADVVPGLEGPKDREKAVAKDFEMKPLRMEDTVAGLIVSSTYLDPTRSNLETGYEHRGVDLAGPVGTPYYAPGAVAVACYSPGQTGGGGYMAQFEHADMTWQLMHLLEGSCVDGPAEQGAVIGKLGNTGRSTGPHLHLQLLDGDRNFIKPMRGHAAAVLYKKTASSGAVNIDALRRAIIGKESAGNFRAVNPDSGALGYGQVMPANVASWTRAALGQALSPAQFLADPDAQLATINHKLNEYVQHQIDAGYSEELAVRRVASMWYSGQADLYDDQRSQPYGSTVYESIQSYTLGVLSKYNSLK
ncbi:MAG: M23 family metallopeptidase [Cyanobacteria bacterium P01_C01_bin.120]